MANIGFFPLYETSHLNATYGLAKKLQSRGHSVSYVAPLDLEDHIRAQGFLFTPFCPSLFPKGVLHQIISKPDEQKKLWGRAFKMLCKGELDAEVKDYAFDLWIVDTWAQQLALIAYKVGIPVVLLSPTLPTTRDFNIPPATEAIVPNALLSKSKIWLCWLKYDLRRLRLYLKKKTANHAQLMRMLASSANYPLKQLDVSGPYPVLKLFSELILCPEEFDLPRFRKNNRIRYIGACVDLDRKENEPFPWERISRDKKLVYCSLGTLTHRFAEAKVFLQTIIDAVASKEDWQLVMSVGQHLNVDDFEPVPPNVILVNRAPQLEILNSASIVITHGGLNTIKESILCAIPMIIFPWSRPLNAVRVVYHGLGLMGDVEKISIEQIQSMIETIDRDPTFKARIERMREKFVEAENSDAGVAAVESFLPRVSS